MPSVEPSEPKSGPAGAQWKVGTALPRRRCRERTHLLRAPHLLDPSIARVDEHDRDSRVGAARSVLPERDGPERPGRDALPDEPNGVALRLETGVRTCDLD